MKKESTEIVPPANTNAPLATYDYGQDAGAGLTGLGSEFFQMPYLTLLQILSPEVSGSPEELVDDAKAGDFFNTVTGSVTRGSQGVIIQPVHVKQTFVEWVPREDGGGKVGEHNADSAIVLAAKARATEWNDIRTEDGNSLEQTFYMLALVHECGLDPNPQPAMISFTSTKIRVLKQLLSRLSLLCGGKVPLYANLVTMYSVHEKNSAGQPFHNVAFRPALGKTYTDSLIDPTSSAFAVAKQLRESFVAGAK